MLRERMNEKNSKQNSSTNNVRADFIEYICIRLSGGGIVYGHTAIPVCGVYFFYGRELQTRELFFSVYRFFLLLFAYCYEFECQLMCSCLIVLRATIAYRLGQHWHYVFIGQ